MDRKKVPSIFGGGDSIVKPKRKTEFAMIVLSYDTINLIDNFRRKNITTTAEMVNIIIDSFDIDNITEDDLLPHFIENSKPKTIAIRAETKNKLKIIMAQTTIKFQKSLTIDKMVYIACKYYKG